MICQAVYITNNSIFVQTLFSLSLFAKRQISRVTIRSRRGAHYPIGQNAPRKLQREITRRLEQINQIKYEPKLLVENDYRLTKGDISGGMMKYMPLISHLWQTVITLSSILDNCTCCLNCQIYIYTLNLSTRNKFMFFCHLFNSYTGAAFQCHMPAEFKYLLCTQVSKQR